MPVGSGGVNPRLSQAKRHRLCDTRARERPPSQGPGTTGEGNRPRSEWGSVVGAVAGSGTGGDTALRLFGESPEWFAGAIVIDPTCSEQLTLRNQADLRGKNVLHTVSRTASNETLACNLDTVRLLRSTGVEVDVRVTEEPLDPCCNDARFIDNWLLSRLNCEAYV